MELVLLRHAKAEECPPWISDEERNLTPKGRKKAQAAAKGLVKFLHDVDQLEIWSSHALRSVQTAQILAANFGGMEVKEYRYIYTGRLEEVMKELRQMRADAVVVVVGHEPHLGVWAKQLAGVTLPFKKCAAAGFKIDFEEELNIKLEWFASSKILAKLGEE
ncbi:MAG: phosphohistidine phosphatase [Firmicutes bacterium]|nr:phosphohistidine phosphatase [Bacillota bacterium]